MRRHGHHAAGETDIAVPRWSERPDDVLGIVQGYLEGAERFDPSRTLEGRTRERERWLADCHTRLHHPLQRGCFDFLLRRAQACLVLRENLKNEFIRVLTAARRIFLELGDRLSRRGLLEQRDDIFFLTLEEIEPVRCGTAAFDLKAVIRSRREEFRRNQELTPPPVIVGHFEPARRAPLGADVGRGELKGLPVSAGVVTGPARVILSADAHQRVFPGEILVAPFTNPGWTPYFLTAAGLVADLGGQLSHGSVIAREYGLPAVVNVQFATQVIQTGDRIRVDGDRGTVTVLERVAADNSARSSQPP